MAKTKILATLGPSCSDKKTILDLIEVGADAFRINMSHGTAETVRPIFEEVKAAIAESGKSVPVFFDLRGPKLRIGKITGGEFLLNDGDTLTITTEKVEEGTTRISTDYHALHREVSPGKTILLDDGQIVCTVTEINGNDVVTRVETGGLLKSNKGMALPGIEVDIPALTDKDIGDVELGMELGADGFMLSFVQKPEDIFELHGVMRAKRKRLPVIAKIETYAAIKNLEGIAEVADALLVARGDLGVEMPIYSIPKYQKKIIDTAHKYRKPAIVATEMLESMVHKIRPTRAEVSDISSAVRDGADMMMLSAETAVGKYPHGAISIMNQIARETEKGMPPVETIPELPEHPVPEMVCNAAVNLAHSLNARALILYTESGFTARISSMFRPNLHIVAFTATKEISDYLNIYRGVVPIVLDKDPGSFDVFITQAQKILIEKGIFKNGDIVVATNINRKMNLTKSNSIRVFTV